MKNIKDKTYKEFWSEKGEYGIIRYERMFLRKRDRHNKRSSRSRRSWFTCEMGYEDCENRGYCNGDC